MLPFPKGKGDVTVNQGGMKKFLMRPLACELLILK